MSFTRVLLLSPPSRSRYGGLRVPAGIGYIAQALQQDSVEYEYLDMRIGHSFKQLKRKLSSFQPDLIGVSMITLEYRNTYRLISHLKELCPDVKVVVGGHHVTILKENVLDDCGAIDFGVVSDGERTIRELCKGHTPLDGIKGLIFRKNGDIHFNGERSDLHDLDDIEFPRYEKFNMKDYSKQIPVHSSRGCPNQCTFCPNKLIGRKFRTRSVNRFVDEIEYWYARGIRQFAIDDDNFTLLPERVFATCDEIERRGLKGLLIRCSNGIRADRIDRPLLARMKEVGVREIGIGADGGNNRVLQSLKKGETIERIERAVKEACDLGIDVKLFIIVGTPHETAEDIEDSIQLARKYPIARVNFNNAIPYPGTEMFDYVKKNNLFVIPPEEYLNNISEEKPLPVFETPELPREQRVEILKRCHEVEKEIMRNTAYRMYRNYPVLRVLIRYFFVVNLFEKLFFQNLFFRKLFERIRYRKLMSR